MYSSHARERAVAEEDKGGGLGRGLLQQEDTREEEESMRCMPSAGLFQGGGRAVAVETRGGLGSRLTRRERGGLGVA